MGRPKTKKRVPHFPHGDEVDVIFRVFTKTGQVIAFFPEMIADSNPNNCLSYMHVGQHSAADYSALAHSTKENKWTPQTRMAKVEEYSSLKTELEGLGYVLAIRFKETRRHYQLRKGQVQSHLLLTGASTRASTRASEKECSNTV
ncbi:hypothetical protein K9N68_37610 (plasmid) [Kovacikia minuta CCNUW1]|uniref:hypothetical protein n=1 Tax=Kovacikia minuta TaxID=2931930 RepID=UPI001CC9697A|nr:hypothetical protein [Kovacikia minuta]UBF29931.1 hypothetical protein K9N68_37610 [Kovacikia minuta CCNUW1]